jgi:hypothetical protein
MLLKIELWKYQDSQYWSIACWNLTKGILKDNKRSLISSGKPSELPRTELGKTPSRPSTGSGAIMKRSQSRAFGRNSGKASADIGTPSLQVSARAPTKCWAPFFSAQLNSECSVVGLRASLPHSRSLSSPLLSLHSHCRSQPSASCHFCFQPHSPPYSRSLSSPLLSLHSRCRSQPLTLFFEQSCFSDDDFLHCNFRVSMLVSLSAQGVIQGTGVISFVIYSEA